MTTTDGASAGSPTSDGARARPGTTSVGVPTVDVIEELANRLYRSSAPPSPVGVPSVGDAGSVLGLVGGAANAIDGALPPGEAAETVRSWFDQAADVCPGPGLLRELMRAPAGPAPADAPPAPATLLPLAGETQPGGYYFLAGSSLAGPSTSPVSAAGMQDVQSVRDDFPALHQRIGGRPLVWLDNAATTHKPRSVIDAVATFYAEHNSNVHRGAHTLARRATDLYEGARERVQWFLSAASPREIVWLRGTTEAINLVAQSYGRQCLGPGDEVLVSEMEHHSNIVPWQLVCLERGARLLVIPIDDHGDLLLDAYARLLSARTKIVAVTHVSNVLGTVNPLHPIIDMAHAAGAKVVVDGAQAVQHLPVDVRALDVDFYAFSGHKLFGPSGIGALYGKLDLLEDMPPWQGGGGMIEQVAFDHTTFAPVPAKFEAGTGHLAGAVGLGAAIEYIQGVGFENILSHEARLLAHGTQLLSGIPGLRLVGTSATKASTLSFVIAGVPAEQIGTYLDRYGIAVRAGHHCAQPALRRYGLTAAVRASIALYNTVDELETLADALRAGLREGWQ